MTDEEGEAANGEGEAGAVGWRVRAGPRNEPTAREREEHEATHMPFRDWCTHCMMHVSKQSSNDSHGHVFFQTKFHCELSDNTRRVSDVHCVPSLSFFLLTFTRRTSADTPRLNQLCSSFGRERLQNHEVHSPYLKPRRSNFSCPFLNASKKVATVESGCVTGRIFACTTFDGLQ